MFYFAKFNKKLNSWNIIKEKYLLEVFSYSEIEKENMPYWINIVDFEKRKQAIEIYQKAIKENKLFNNIIYAKEIKTIKNKI